MVFQQVIGRQSIHLAKDQFAEIQLVSKHIQLIEMLVPQLSPISVGLIDLVTLQHRITATSHRVTLVLQGSVQHEAFYHFSVNFLKIKPKKDQSIGFWCVNDEQPDGLCADFAVRFCCPKEWRSFNGHFNFTG